MPYISSEDVKAKRKEIRAAFPDYKLSVTKDGHSGICVTFMEGPLALTENTSGYVQVNRFHIDRNYEEQPEVRDLLQKANNIAARGVRELTYDSDYGSVPTFYVSIHIGKWDRPYEVRA